MVGAALLYSAYTSNPLGRQVGSRHGDSDIQDTPVSCIVHHADGRLYDILQSHSTARYGADASRSLQNDVQILRQRRRRWHAIRRRVGTVLWVLYMIRWRMLPVHVSRSRAVSISRCAATHRCARELSSSVLWGFEQKNGDITLST